MLVRERAVEVEATKKRWTVSHQIELETLDAPRLAGVEQASAQISEIAYGQRGLVSYSNPQLRNGVLFWCICCHRTQGTTPVSRQYQRRVQKKATLDDDVKAKKWSL
jgi:hypothetical protein